MPQPARRRPRPRRRRARRIAGALSVAVLTTSGLMNVAMRGVGDGIGRVDAFAGLDNRPPRGAGENFLLVGTDGRERLTRAERTAYRLGGEPCHCTDTIMLAHLSRDRRRLTVVSVPRDTEVPLPAGDGHPAGPAKLNSAYQRGGPRLTVSTVEHLTGVHVDHYLELDFAGFMRTVDALGGVPVCTPVPLRDPESGLDLPAGTTVLDGGRALEYVRARHLDATADLGRMNRQQRFVAEVVRRATAGGLLLDPVRLAATVRDTLGSVRADAGLGSGDLVRLAEAVRDLGPDSTEFASVPVSTPHHRLPGGAEAVTWKTAPARALFDAVRADRPLTRAAARPAATPHGTPVPVDPRTVRVEVTGADRAAVRHVRQALAAQGFAVRTAVRHPRGAPVPAASSGTAAPLLSYDPRWDRSIRSLAAALPGSARRAVPRLGGVLRVALGTGTPRVAPVRYASTSEPAGPGDGIGGAVRGSRELCG